MLSTKEQFQELSQAKMPFGRYKNQYLTDLPEPYLVWFKNQGFPKGKLGDQLKLVLELKMNGLEGLVQNFRQQFPTDRL